MNRKSFLTKLVALTLCLSFSWTSSVGYSDLGTATQAAQVITSIFSTTKLPAAAPKFARYLSELRTENSSAVQSRSELPSARAELRTASASRLGDVKSELRQKSELDLAREFVASAIQTGQLKLDLSDRGGEPAKQILQEVLAENQKRQTEHIQGIETARHRIATFESRFEKIREEIDFDPFKPLTPAEQEKIMEWWADDLYMMEYEIRNYLAEIQSGQHPFSGNELDQVVDALIAAYRWSIDIVTFFEKQKAELLFLRNQETADNEESADTMAALSGAFSVLVDIKSPRGQIPENVFFAIAATKRPKAKEFLLSVLHEIGFDKTKSETQKTIRERALSYLFANFNGPDLVTLAQQAIENLSVEQRFDYDKWAFENALKELLPYISSKDVQAYVFDYLKDPLQFGKALRVGNFLEYLVFKLETAEIPDWFKKRLKIYSDENSAAMGDFGITENPEPYLNRIKKLNDFLTLKEAEIGLPSYQFSHYIFRPIRSVDENYALFQMSGSSRPRSLDWSPWDMTDFVLEDSRTHQIVGGSSFTHNRQNPSIDFVALSAQLKGEDRINALVFILAGTLQIMIPKIKGRGVVWSTWVKNILEKTLALDLAGVDLEPFINQNPDDSRSELRVKESPRSKLHAESAADLFKQLGLNSSYDLDAAHLIDQIPISPDDRVLGIGMGSQYQPLFATAVRGAHVDVVQPRLYEIDWAVHENQTDELESNIRSAKEKMVGALGADLIGNRIDLNSYQGRIQEVKLPSNHYAIVYLFRVLDYPPAMNDREGMMKAIYDAIKEQAVIFISTLNDEGLRDVVESAKWYFTKFGATVEITDRELSFNRSTVREIRVTKSPRSELRNQTKLPSDLTTTPKILKEPNRSAGRFSRFKHRISEWMLRFGNASDDALLFITVIPVLMVHVLLSLVDDIERPHEQSVLWLWASVGSSVWIFLVLTVSSILFKYQNLFRKKLKNRSNFRSDNINSKISKRSELRASEIQDPGMIVTSLIGLVVAVITVYGFGPKINTWRELRKRAVEFVKGPAGAFWTATGIVMIAAYETYAFVRFKSNFQEITVGIVAFSFAFFYPIFSVVMTRRASNFLLRNYAEPENEANRSELPPTRAELRAASAFRETRSMSELRAIKIGRREAIVGIAAMLGAGAVALKLLKPKDNQPAQKPEDMTTAKLKFTPWNQFDYKGDLESAKHNIRVVLDWWVAAGELTSADRDLYQKLLDRAEAMKGGFQSSLLGKRIDLINPEKSVVLINVEIMDSFTQSIFAFESVDYFLELLGFSVIREVRGVRDSFEYSSERKELGELGDRILVKETLRLLGQSTTFPTEPFSRYLELYENELRRLAALTFVGEFREAQFERGVIVKMIKNGIYSPQRTEALPAQRFNIKKITNGAMRRYVNLSDDPRELFRAEFKTVFSIMLPLLTQQRPEIPATVVRSYGFYALREFERAKGRPVNGANYTFTPEMVRGLADRLWPEVQLLLNKPRRSELRNPVLEIHQDWKSIFSDTSKPLVVDVGFGNGETLLHRAQHEPEKNFIGIELPDEPYADLLAERIQAEGIQNLKVLKAADYDAFRVQLNLGNEKIVSELTYYDPIPGVSYAFRMHFEDLKKVLMPGALVKIIVYESELQQELLERFEQHGFKPLDPESHPFEENLDDAAHMSGLDISSPALKLVFEWPGLSPKQSELRMNNNHNDTAYNLGPWVNVPQVENDLVSAISIMEGIIAKKKALESQGGTYRASPEDIDSLVRIAMRNQKRPTFVATISSLLDGIDSELSGFFDDWVNSTDLKDLRAKFERRTNLPSFTIELQPGETFPRNVGNASVDWKVDIEKIVFPNGQNIHIKKTPVRIDGQEFDKIEVTEGGINADPKKRAFLNTLMPIVITNDDSGRIVPGADTSMSGSHWQLGPLEDITIEIKLRDEGSLTAIEEVFADSYIFATNNSKQPVVLKVRFSEEHYIPSESELAKLRKKGLPKPDSSNSPRSELRSTAVLPAGRQTAPEVQSKYKVPSPFQLPWFQLTQRDWAPGLSKSFLSALQRKTIKDRILAIMKERNLDEHGLLVQIQHAAQLSKPPVSTEFIFNSDTYPKWPSLTVALGLALQVDPVWLLEGRPFSEALRKLSLGQRSILLRHRLGVSVAFVAQQLLNNPAFPKREAGWILIKKWLHSLETNRRRLSGHGVSVFNLKRRTALAEFYNVPKEIFHEPSELFLNVDLKILSLVMGQLVSVSERGRAKETFEAIINSPRNRKALEAYYFENIVDLDELNTILKTEGLGAYPSLATLRHILNKGRIKLRKSRFVNEYLKAIQIALSQNDFPENIKVALESRYQFSENSSLEYEEAILIYNELIERSGGDRVSVDTYRKKVLPAAAEFLKAKMPAALELVRSDKKPGVKTNAPASLEGRLDEVMFNFTGAGEQVLQELSQKIGVHDRWALIQFKEIYLPLIQALVGVLRNEGLDPEIAAVDLIRNLQSSLKDWSTSKQGSPDFQIKRNLVKRANELVKNRSELRNIFESSTSDSSSSVRPEGNALELKSPVDLKNANPEAQSIEDQVNSLWLFRQVLFVASAAVGKDFRRMNLEETRKRILSDGIDKSARSMVESMADLLLSHSGRFSDEDVSKILETIKQDVLPFMSDRDRIVFPEPEDWLVYPLLKFFTGSDSNEFKRRILALARYSPRASALFFGLMGPHLRYEHIQTDRDFDTDNYHLILSGFLPRLERSLKQVEHLRRQNTPDQALERETKQYLAALMNGLMFALDRPNLKHMARDSSLFDADQAFLNYKSIFYQRLESNLLLWLRMPRIKPILRRAQRIFPDLFPKYEVPEYLKYWHSEHALGESHFNWLRRMNSPFSAWDFVTGYGTPERYHVPERRDMRSHFIMSELSRYYDKLYWFLLTGQDELPAEFASSTNKKVSPKRVVRHPPPPASQTVLEPRSELRNGQVFSELDIQNSVEPVSQASLDEVIRAMQNLSRHGNPHDEEKILEALGILFDQSKWQRSELRQPGDLQNKNSGILLLPEATENFATVIPQLVKIVAERSELRQPVIIYAKTNLIARSIREMLAGIPNAAELVEFVTSNDGVIQRAELRHIGSLQMISYNEMDNSYTRNLTDSLLKKGIQVVQKNVSDLSGFLGLFGQKVTEVYTEWKSALYNAMSA